MNSKWKTEDLKILAKAKRICLNLDFLNKSTLDRNSHVSDVTATKKQAPLVYTKKDRLLLVNTILDVIDNKGQVPKTNTVIIPIDVLKQEPFNFKDEDFYETMFISESG